MPPSVTVTEERELEKEMPVSEGTRRTFTVSPGG
jgi:hypothetical protein